VALPGRRRAAAPSAAAAVDNYVAAACADSANLMVRPVEQLGRQRMLHH
jgi:hypothetical protein